MSTWNDAGVQKTPNPVSLSSPSDNSARAVVVVDTSAATATATAGLLRPTIPPVQCV